MIPVWASRSRPGMVFAAFGLMLLAACSPDGGGDDAASAAPGERAPMADPAINGTVPDIDTNTADIAPLPPPEVTVQPERPDKELLADLTPVDLPEADNSVILTPFPQEVTDFMVDRDSCEHFRGEEPYDDARRQFLEENIRVLCTGSDRKLDALRRKYRSDPEVITALEPYEKLAEPEED